MPKIIVLWSLLVLSAAPLQAGAETVLRVGEGITVADDQVISGDYYVSVGFGKTTMSGQVAGDMYGLGGSVTVNGEVMEDIALFAGVSQIHASVTDDVRLITGEAVVAESIGGDLFVLGNSLKVLSSAQIGGNVFFFGSDIVIEGDVGGSVFGAANRMRIDGSVVGDVDVKVLHGLTLGSNTVVEGVVTYESPFELVRAPESVVEGGVTKAPVAEPSQQEILRSVLLPVFVSLFATLSLYLLFRRELSVVIAEAENHYIRHSLIGLAVVLAAPIVSILLMVSVLGFLLGAIALMVTGFLFLAGYAISVIVLGAYIAQAFNAAERVSLLWIMVGAITLTLITIVPIIGPIIFAGIFIISVGMLADRLYRHLV